MKKVIAFVKKETVLTVAWVLAIISMIFVHPCKAYIEYIDFRSLGILWSLMVIMAGLQRNGVFESIGKRLLQKTKKVWQLVLVLILLCFVFSMFITNDVALITFVPFAIFMLEECDKKNLLIPVIALQTLAANLGSMLTPIGNPQNLYLYGISGMGVGEFIMLMLPYTLATLALLMVSLIFIPGKREAITEKNSSVDVEGKVRTDSRQKIYRRIGLYIALFILALIVVARLVPYWALVVAVLVIVVLMDWKAVATVDYALLFTFVGFFIFTGNLGNIPEIKEFLVHLVSGNETISGVISSQFISNVPAALLLSNFTSNYNELIIGVNLGGLGTLIASMASLISFKSLAHKHNELKGKYLLVFTGLNLLFLIILLGLWWIIG